MSDDDGRSQPLTPARLRAMAQWFREFASMASVEQRLWQLDLATTYERMALERKTAEAGSAPQPRNLMSA
jgi:hypothetical protein